MKIVVDANIFFAAFIREKSDLRRILLSSELELFTPDWFLEELDKNEKEIIKKMDSTKGYLETKKLLLSFIKIVSSVEYAKYIEIAGKELKENKKDVPYIALCLFLNAPLWSNDIRLKKSQKLVKIITIQEMIEKLL